MKQTLCDKCGKEAAVEEIVHNRRLLSYSLKEEWYPDLCDSCAKPIIEFLEARK